MVFVDRATRTVAVKLSILAGGSKPRPSARHDPGVRRRRPAPGRDPSPSGSPGAKPTGPAGIVEGVKRGKG